MWQRQKEGMNAKELTSDTELLDSLLSVYGRSHITDMRRVPLWFTWGEFCTSGSASQSASRSCRPSQEARRCPSPSLDSLRKYKYTQITHSFILPREYVVCVFRTDKMPNPSSPAALWGWRAGVHGRASRAVRTGWPTGLTARPVKDTHWLLK